MNFLHHKITLVQLITLVSFICTTVAALEFVESSSILKGNSTSLANNTCIISDNTEKLSDYDWKDDSYLRSEEIKYINYNKGKIPPEKFRDWVIYARENQCPTSLEFYQQIYEDLAPFFYLEEGKTISKITREMMDHPNTNGYITRIRIRNHWIEESHMLFNNIVPSLPQIIHLLPKNIYFLFNGGDEDTVLPADEGSSQPRYYAAKEMLENNECIRTTYNNGQKEFVQGTIAYNHGSFISPPTFTAVPKMLPLLSFGKRDCFKDIVYPVIIGLDLSYDKVKWEDKENRVVWRGRNTGTWIRSNNNLYKLSQRYRLANWAIKQKDCVKSTLGIEVDVGFSDMHQCDYKGLCDQVKNEYPILPGLSHKEQLKSKYLIVVDGNNWPFRIAHFLSSNSLVLYNGIFTFWFSRHLKPYVHYLPFKPDFSDLIDQLEYAKNHDEEMKQIVKNAREFAEKYLKSSTASCYWGLLAMEYGELVKHLY